jgi:hypothetical protein
MADTLETEIGTKIAEHEKWRGRDFSRAQWQFWLALGASFLAGILAAVDLPADWYYKVVKVVVTAIPGFIILTEKTFNFAKRSSWHAFYVLRLRALQRRLRDEVAPRDVVSRELSELEEEMDKRFPPLDVGTLPQPATPKLRVLGDAQQGAPADRHPASPPANR